MHPDIAALYHRAAPPRMLQWLLAGLLLMLLGDVITLKTEAATIVHKGAILALGGWAGYWLDRSLFPYDRPHQYLDFDPQDTGPGAPGGADPQADVGSDVLQVGAGPTFGRAMLRRAIVVGACLLCLALSW